MNRLSRRRLLRRSAGALLVGTAGAVALSCVPGEPPAPAPATPREPVQLRVLVPRLEDALVDPLPDWTDAAVKEVNATEPAAYRLTAQALDTPAAEWAETINTLRSAGAPAPDLLAVHLGDVPAMHSRQALLSLESQRKRERSLDLNDYYRPALTAHSWQDQLYALPVVASPQIIYYSQDLFTAFNLSPPRADWRWDDLLVTATKMKRDLDSDGRVDRWGYFQLPGVLLTVPYIWQNGGAVLDPQGNVQLDQPAAVEAIEFIARLLQAAGPNVIELFRPTPAAGAGNTQVTRIQLDASSLAESVLGQVRLEQVGLLPFHLSTGLFWRSPPFNFNLAQPPRQRQPATMLTTSGLAIGAETAHPDESWAALRVLAASLERRGMLPPRKSLAGSLRQIEPRLTDGDIAVMQSALDYARAPAWPRYHQVRDILTRHLDLPLLLGALGAESPQTLVRDASEALRRLLATP